MTTTSPTPRGNRKHSRPLLAATALSALLALSACGSTNGPSPADTGSAAASTSPAAASSASTGASPSASASPTPTVSAEATTTPEASPTEPGPTAPAPEETRMASAPEVGMPPASPSRSEKADQQGVGGVCSASQLSGTATPSNGAAGHVITSLTVTNTGSTPCVLTGYPGVSFVDAAGATVGAPASRTESAAAAVTLQPGASTSTSLSITRPGVIGQICNPHDVTGLRVYPPGSHESLVVAYPGQACGNPKVSQLQVKSFGS